MRKTSPLGIDLIKHEEGLVLHIYNDFVGFPTIGYGHLIRKGETFTRDITEQEAEALLRKDLVTAEYYVGTFLPVELTDHQFDALVSFTFTLGGGALQRSTLRQCLLRGDLMSAADEFPKWVYAGGKKSSVLIRRRQTERRLFLTDIEIGE